ncbi:MAG: hypothetical protein ACKPCM_20200 [Pseudanabaena sp.]
MHFHPPLTLSEYIQEIGRAGRDDKPAEALMLVSEPTGLLDDSDRQRVSFFLQQQQKLQQQAQLLLPQLPRRGNFAEVAQRNPDAAITLGLLHRAGNLVWLTPFEYEIRNLPQQQKLKQSVGVERTIAQMQDYIRVKNDHWAFLLNNFGFEEEAKLLLKSNN